MRPIFDYDFDVNYLPVDILSNSHIFSKEIMSMSSKSRFWSSPTPSFPVTDLSNEG
jgi:hypothetical protein